MDDAMSCNHYQRKCFLMAPCCNKQYSCRICHDELESHQIDRYSVQQLVCMQCKTSQQVAKNCLQCGILFGNYSCLICRLFDDNDRKQFHCDGCGICRVGGRENFYHCPKCEMCLGVSVKDTHKCIEKSSQRNCPVCLENIHTSRIQTHVPKCGHLIHGECFNGMLEHGQAYCPVCNESLVDLSSHWNELDTIIAETPMPHVYQNYHVNILCRDCHKESNVLFHVVGLKCSQCGGYNTTRIGGDDPIPEYTGDFSELSLNQRDDDEESWQTVSDESGDSSNEDNEREESVNAEGTHSEVVNLSTSAETEEEIVSNPTQRSNEVNENSTFEQLRTNTTDPTTDDTLDLSNSSQKDN